MPPSHPLSAEQTITGLSGFHGRGAGTDTERRAALWLAGQLRTLGRSARLETFWCRPNWALAQAWHVALGLAGTLTSVGSPRVGGALILIALLAVVADVQLGISPGRRLTPERASQNVVSPPPEGASAPVRLVITANIDVDRGGLIRRPTARRLLTRIDRLAPGVTPGWLGWLSLALIWLLAVAVARLEGARGTAIGILQLPPAGGLVLALALLLEQGTADFDAGAGDNSSGVAAALALEGALATGPPGNLGIELLLQGAAHGGGAGLRRYLRRRRKTLRPATAVLLGFCPCEGGRPGWWTSEGALLPLRHLAALRELAEQAAAQAPGLKAAPIRTHRDSPVPPAASRGLPSLALGSIEPQPSGGPSSSDAIRGSQRLCQFGLMVVDGIDAHVAAARSGAGALRRRGRLRLSRGTRS